MMDFFVNLHNVKTSNVNRLLDFINAKCGAAYQLPPSVGRERVIFAAISLITFALFCSMTARRKVSTFLIKLSVHL